MKRLTLTKAKPDVFLLSNIFWPWITFFAAYIHHRTSAHHTQASSNNSCIYEAMLEPGWEVRGYNATLRESSFSKYCILQTSCEFVTCEPGSTKRTNAAEIVTVPVHQHDPDWWMEFCEKVGCVDQVVLEATTMPALGAQQQHACD